MMTRIEVLRALAEGVDQAAFIATCGATARELASLGQRPNHLHMLNSMGLAGPLGMGVALGSGVKTVVIEGDGGMLMGLNFLATLAHVAPPGLVMCVLDNGAYCSTGCQPTAATTVDLGRLAESAGLPVYRVENPEELHSAIEAAREARGPVFLHIRIGTEAAPGVRYFQPDPPVVSGRFAEWLGSRKQNSR